MCTIGAEIRTRVWQAEEIDVGGNFPPIAAQQWCSTTVES